MSGLYIHIPFCRRKCPYCDFYSVVDAAADLAGYARLLIRQMEMASAFWQEPLATVFFGGGTPSLLAPADVATVLAAARAYFGLVADAEITLEANPGTVSAESLAGFREAGVNRLSLGIQSLKDDHLRRLGRLHSSAVAKEAVVRARQAGFTNLSCDLMFALPGQDTIDLRAEIDIFLDLAPDHLSCYGLTLEENTPFWHLHRAGGLVLAEEELFRDLYLQVHEQLSAAGYRHYEISNFARPGAECRHNLAYWRRRPYLGIGAGAHSFLGRGWGERWAVPPDLDHFSAALGRGEDPAELLESFDVHGAMAETIYLGLRTADGVAEAEFRGLFGKGVREVFPVAVQAAKERLRFVQGRWSLDLEGWLLYDHLIADFL